MGIPAGGQRTETTMENGGFIVKVKRRGHTPEFVQRIDRAPVQRTTNRKLALLMGRFTAEDVARSLQSPRRSPELVSVEVGA